MLNFQEKEKIAKRLSSQFGIESETVICDKYGFNLKLDIPEMNAKTFFKALGQYSWVWLNNKVLIYNAY